MTPSGSTTGPPSARPDTRRFPAERVFFAALGVRRLGFEPLPDPS
jgi:hypothetical protein